MRKILIVPVLLVLASCYHATVDTGAARSGVTVERDWAHSFLGGLVPPSTVDATAECPHGAARVETQLSFLNMVASAVTFGIYTPMSITVHCAAPPAGAMNVIELPDGATRADLAATLLLAAERSRSEGSDVWVTFGDLAD